MAIAATTATVGVMCVIRLATGSQAMFGLFAVVAGTTAAGPGLAGADTDLDRTAAFWWPPRRAAHVILASAAVMGIVAGATLAGEPLAPASQLGRHITGLMGLVALSAAAFGARLAWVAPVTWIGLAWTANVLFGPDPAFHVRVLTWMFQPPGSVLVTVTATVLGAVGTLAYAFLGARP
jgi:hypothetical protein